MALAHQGDEVKEPRTPTDEIVARFDNSVGTWDERKASEAMRGAFQNMAAAINDDIVDSRAKSQALTLLEDASMWVQKAIFEDLPPKPKKISVVTTVPEPQRLYVWMGDKDEKFKAWLGDRFRGYSEENVPGQAKDKVWVHFINFEGDNTGVSGRPAGQSFEKLINGSIILHP